MSKLMIGRIDEAIVRIRPGAIAKSADYELLKELEFRPNFNSYKFPTAAFVISFLKEKRKEYENMAE